MTRTAVLMTAVVVAGSLVLCAAPAVAAVRAQRASLVGASSHSWAVTPVLPGGTGTGPLTLAWTVSGSSAYSLLDLLSTGSASVTGQTIAITSTQTSSGSPNLPTITLEACVGGTWTSISACSGTITSVGASTTSVTSSLTLAPGARVSVRASGTNAATKSYSTSLTVSVPRSNVRPGTIVNS